MVAGGRHLTPICQFFFNQCCHGYEVLISILGGPARVSMNIRLCQFTNPCNHIHQIERRLDLWSSKNLVILSLDRGQGVYPSGKIPLEQFHEL